MFDVFHWRVRVTRETAYAKRVEECRRLAEVGPEHLRQGYLDLAAEYERLVEKSAQIVRRGSDDKEE